MAEARVITCHLQGGRAMRGTAAQVEDALRLAPLDGGRLLVLRRLDLGHTRTRGTVAARRILAARAAAGLRDAVARAVHGAAPHAAASDVVWFRSPEEARRLLILRLLRGERAAAWFWHLAVPLPPGPPAAGLIAETIAAARHRPEAEAALARLVRAAAEAGRLPALVSMAPPEPGGVEPIRPTGRSPPVGYGTPAAEDVAALMKLLAKVPEDVRRGLRDALADARGAGPAPLWLRRAAVLVAAPGALAAPRQLAALAEALAQPSALVVPASEAKSPPLASDGPRRHVQPRRLEATLPRDVRPRLEAAAVPPAAPDPVGPVPALTPAAAPDAPAPETGEAFSAAAGVFLTLVALRRIGFDGWLAERPELVLAGFGAAFLRHLAERVEVDQADPTLALLPAPDAPPPEPLIRLWCSALDGWLRRRTRRRLSDVTRRRGWLLPSDERLDVRYPLAAADIRLRRLALDTDPGWTPWLARSVHFHFRDEPLP